MKISDLICLSTPQSGLKNIQLNIVKESCSIFLNTFGELPMIKRLNEVDTFIKKKVRYKKNHKIYTDNKTKMYFERGLYTFNGSLLTERSADSYYVFPIDGFHFLSTPINIGFKQYMSEVQEKLDKSGFQITEDGMEDFLRQICKQDIIESTHSEFVFYNISHFYAINTSEYPEYRKLLNVLTN